MSATEPTRDEARKALEWLNGAVDTNPGGDDQEKRFAEVVERRRAIVAAFIDQHADPRPPAAADVSRETFVQLGRRIMDAIDAQALGVRWDNMQAGMLRGETEPVDVKGGNCRCEPDDDGLFIRACVQCGTIRGTGHCYHDRIQRNCPACGYLPEGAVTPLQRFGGA